MNVGQVGCKSHLSWCCTIAFLVLAVSPHAGMGEEGVGKAANGPTHVKFRYFDAAKVDDAWAWLREGVLPICGR